MASENPNQKNSLYPQVIVDVKPEPCSSNPSSNLYPKIDKVENLLPNDFSPSAPPLAAEEVLIKVPGAILHLIDKECSVELACGDLKIICLRQGPNAVGYYANVGDIQWPMAKDEAAVKVDDSHYFFSLHMPAESKSDSSSDEEEKRGIFRLRRSRTKKLKDSVPSVMSYGLTIALRGQEDLLKELDKVLQECSAFSVQKVSEEAKKEGEALDASVAREVSPADLQTEEKREMMEEKCAAYWTTLAPNVEDYSGTAARLIAAGSGQLVKGILWCGDVTVERLRWGNEIMKTRMAPGTQEEINPETMKRIQRVKRMTEMTESVANGVLTGVVKVSGYFTSSLANSKAGKKIFSLLPGEVVLASLDGFSKVCDAVEVAGKSVMTTSNTVTTELVSHRYGDEAAKATSEGLGAAGHAVGTAWAAFKLRQALNPKSVIKPTALSRSAAQAAAAELNSKMAK
ncbi:protein EARLY-RESPONSIVE TO DEHYDRATION 7, chloroplastic [Vigna unguiculata]|uniref:protein EARLY-RESPONSIVE TO DEHYDRATION 7, chloroplastic n=1 Tax=Vigna unguiculata TaxID=3917 RepID=UPI001016D526|nr:protein EARLY-RESPONSIVE TO DEHYDRATION 7, chloroplastic [Vigna unguiculata]